MKTELIENCICKCGHGEKFHKVDGEFTVECLKCDCQEYME